MNLTMAIFMVNRDVRAVRCQYDPTDSRDNSIRTFKTLDQTIKKDDLVVVPTKTRQGYTVVKVIEDHVFPDLNSSEIVDWIVTKLRLENHEKRLKDEQLVVDLVRQADFRRQQSELKNSIIANNPELESEMKALALYKNGDNNTQSNGSTGA